MKVCNVSLASAIQRFFLMMAVVIALGFMGQFTLAAIMGFAISTTCILGMSFSSFSKEVEKVQVKKESKYNVMEVKESLRQAV